MPSLADIALLGGQQRASHYQRLADIQADTRRQNAGLWAAAIHGIGQSAGNVAQSFGPEAKANAELAKQRADLTGLQIEDAKAARAAAQQKAQTTATFRDMLKTARITDPDTGLVTYDRPKLQNQFADMGMGDQWLEYEPLLEASDKSIKAAKVAQNDALKDLARIAKRSQASPDVFAAMVDRALDNRIVNEQEATAILQALERDPSMAPKIIDSILDVKPELHNAPAGTNVLDARNPGAGPVYTSPAAPKEATPPNVGTFEDFVVRMFGPNPTAAQITQARQQYAKAAHVEGQGATTPIGIVDPNDPTKTVYVNPRDAVGQRPAASREGGRPPTGADRQTLAYYNRMKSALEDMMAVEDRLTTKDLAFINENISLPEVISNAQLTREGQAYAQALRTYTEARLRKESGAAIQPFEYENDRKMVGRMLNDKPETLAQKRRSREGTAEGVAYASGPAYEEYFGEKYQSPSQKKAAENKAAANAYKGEVRTTADGRFLGMVDGKPVEVVKVGNVWTVK